MAPARRRLTRDAWLGRQARDVRERLATLVEGEPGALGWFSREAVEAMHAEAGGSYGFRFDGAAAQLEFVHSVRMSTNGTIVSLLETMLGGLPARWGFFNPLRPEPAQRNVVQRQPVPRVVDEKSPAVVAAVYAPTGFTGVDQFRVLLCDGPLLMAHFAVLTHDTFAPADAALLRALVPALRRRLVLERLVDGAALATHALAATLEAIPRPALLVRAGGTIRHLNSAAAAWLAGQRPDGASAIRASLARHPAAPFAVFPVRARGVPRHSLLVHRRLPAGLPLPVADAAARWKLSPRQAAVLRLLARGCANRTIAAALDLAENTVEHHVTRLLRRAGVDSRAALVARLWGGG